MSPVPDEPARTGRLGRQVARIAIDITPLRVSRDFRRLWLGLLVSELGYHFTVVATFVQIFELTGSTAATGLVGLFGLAAIVIGTLAGGTFIDATDRRTTLLASQLAFCVGSGLLLAGALRGEPSVWVVYGGVSIIAGVSAIDSSVRHAITPRLVGRELLPSALALNQVVWNATALLGPAIAGIVIARFGLAWAYGFDVISYLAMFAVALTLRPVPPEPTDEPRTGWKAVTRGFTYLRDQRVVRGALSADVVAMVFGMPRALFPILAVTQFERGPETVGMLFAAPAVGALLGALSGGWVRRVEHQGRAVLWAVAAWGASIAAFGLAGTRLTVALVMLAVAGGADVISAIFRGTIIQLSVPDALRGRLSSLNYLVVAGGPRLGDLRAGLAAAAFSPTVSVVSGGLLCIVGAGVVALVAPSLVRYRASSRPPVPADPA
ncbi:MAG TPA: MFS transporter [Actinomycetota bacterium]|nr:MFS transporter [Actinomycetota bacterium]